METTTGMSAPPIGTISVTPSRKASAATAQNAASPCPATNQAPEASISNANARLSGCWPAKTTGRPDTSPCNLAKASTEPVKVKAPIAMPSTISILLSSRMAPPGSAMP